MLELDLNDIDTIAEGLLEKREEKINDDLVVMHQAAILISQAIWGSKDFPTKTPYISLKHNSKEDILGELQTELEMMNKMFEADKTE